MGGFRRFLSKANYEVNLHNFSGGVFLSLINEGYRFIRGSTWIRSMYGLRTDGRVWVDGWMGGFAKVDNVFWVDCLLMCTEMGSSIVMYNFGVGHGGPYKSANLEGHQR